MLSRRDFLSVAGGATAVFFVTGELHAGAASGDVNARGTKALVYLSPTCGCCADWVKHLQKNGFTVETRKMEDVDPMKIKLKVPESGWDSDFWSLQDWHRNA